MTTASEKCYNHEFNQKRFLDGKYILLNHRYDALQFYESIHTHSYIWGLFMPPSPTISKFNPMGGGWKRPFISAYMFSKRLYMSKLIAKIIDANYFWDQSVILSIKLQGQT